MLHLHTDPQPPKQWRCGTTAWFWGRDGYRWWKVGDDWWKAETEDEWVKMAKMDAGEWQPVKAENGHRLATWRYADFRQSRL